MHILIRDKSCNNYVGYSFPILPRRLTLKSNPPIYDWLWFRIGFTK